MALFFTKRIIPVFLCLLVFSLNAREKHSFLAESKKPILGFGGPLAEFTFLNGETFTMQGGKCALVAGKNFFAGLYGINSLTDLSIAIGGIENVKVHLAQYGAWLGYIRNLAKNINLLFSLKSGYGNISVYQDKYTTINHKPERVFNQISGSKGIMLTPSADLHIKIFRWLSVSAEAGYRLVMTEKAAYISSSDFNSPAFSFSLLIGSFGSRVN